MRLFLAISLFFALACSGEPSPVPPVPGPQGVDFVVQEVRDIEVNGQDCKLMRVEYRGCDSCGWSDYMRFVDCDGDICNAQYQNQTKPFELR